MQRQLRLLVALAAVVIVVVLFFVFRSGGGNDNAPPTATTIEITITDGKPMGGIAEATATQGQTVHLIVHSDVADEVHVHGYDLHKDVAAGGTAEITFEAKIAGEFEAELESRGVQILALTVKP